MKAKVARRKTVRVIQIQRAGRMEDSITKKTAAICENVFAFPKMLGRKLRNPAMANNTALAARMEISRLKTSTVNFHGILCRIESTRNIVLNKELVRDGIEILAEQSLLMQLAGQQSIQPVAESGNHEEQKRPEITALHQFDHDKRNKNHPQQRELVGRGEDLRQLHAGSPFE